MYTSSAMKVAIENKKARLEYEFLETYDAGLELHGFEVKALRNGKGSLLGSRVVVRGGEAYLIGASIPPHQERNAPASYDPERSRRLLLNKKEIQELATYEGQRGLTIIPIVVYNNKRLKLHIAVARKKKKHDKRALLKERDVKRSINRSLKDEY